MNLGIYVIYNKYIYLYIFVIYMKSYAILVDIRLTYHLICIISVYVT